MICLKILRFYQKFLSPLKPATCRYYPSCSEYALWQFQKKNFFLAFFSTFFRILRCNP
ncbi:membrane protein insertion efficiency factor YidD, partial [Campylobacter jejuni]|nr:membrane protein insertion efficiency factor YidD [Campylobacter jejuni]